MKALTEEKILNFLKTKTDRRCEINNVFRNFTREIIPELIEIRDNSVDARRNIYELADAARLSVANAVTRTFSTKLGLFWEEIADLAPNVVSPELDFNIKIPEVDVIVLYNKKLYYTQLKTQKNTLTGSQGKRTVAELSKYPNSWFVACIDTNSEWTAPKSLNRLLASEFWDKIGIDYNKDIYRNLEILIKEVEDIVMNSK